MDDMILVFEDDGTPILQSEDVRFNIKKSNDTVARISVRKEANGSSFQEARNTAEKIKYEYTQQGNSILFNNFLTTEGKSKFNDLDVRVNLYLASGQHIKYAPTNRRNWTVRAETDRDIDSLDEYLWKMGDDGVLVCQDCPINMDEDDTENRIRINEGGIDIYINHADGESFEMKIDDDGVRIKAQDNNEENN